MVIVVWACFWTLCSVPLIYVSVFVFLLCCLCYYGTVIYNSKSSVVMPSDAILECSNFKKDDNTKRPGLTYNTERFMSL